MVARRAVLTMIIGAVIAVCGAGVASSPPAVAPGSDAPDVHTALPTSVRTLLATAPASDGVASWTWTEEAGCDIGTAFDSGGRPYYAVVLAAYTASGHSIFTNAEPGGWWRPGLTDIVC